jgi:hypothetical protein
MPRVFVLSHLLAELPASRVDELDWPTTELQGGKLRVRCKEHAAEYLISPGNLRRGQKGCPVCAAAGRSAGTDKKKHEAMAKALAAAIESHGSKYDYSDLQTDSVTQLASIRCPTHGVFHQTMVNHSRGHGCDACAQIIRTQKRTGGDWEERSATIRAFCSSRGYEVVDDLGTPRAWRAPLTVMCKHHGAFQSTVGSLAQGKGCWKCFTEFRAGKQSNEDGAATFVTKAQKVHGDAYDYSKFVYVDSYVKGEVFCRKHKKAFMVSPGNHVQGKGCPSCGVQLSRGEDEIASFLKSYTTVHQRVRDVIAPKELDIFLPDHNLAIEYHGLYWHTEDRVGTDHFDKWKSCADAGIELWQVFEDEWETRRDVIQQRLLARIGQAAKIGARACTVVNVGADDARVFFDRTHSQGGLGYSPINLGLKHGDALVAVATFGRQRNGAMVAAQGWEVLRYAAVGTVVGGFGRLFAEFLRRHDPEDIVSFCDLRWGNGRMYQAVGFRLEHITPPDYWWLACRSGKKRIPRYQTQKHKLKAHPILGAFYRDDLTERQICEAAGWRRILGVGQQRWVWTRLQNPATLAAPKPSFS